MPDKPIYVTVPSLPPLEELTPYLERIWDKKYLTNDGPLHQELEAALCDYLNVPYISLFNNGTIALISALAVADLSGEVIITPFSFIATAHALVWNNLTPVFVDIDKKTFNLDPEKIEAAITPQTTAILAVHCYGQPCNIAAIQAIADKHNLKVIYDAAHTFGVIDDQGRGLARAGNLSALSFHATKVFNTFEGGAVICHDAQTKAKIDSHKNFGIIDELTVEGVGINGKMSEINAAMGLAQLNHIEDNLQKRSKVDERYREALANIPGIECLEFSGIEKQNYAYFPVLIKEEYGLSRDELCEALKKENIFARRYFYPLMSEFGVYKDLPSASPDNLPVASHCAQQVLCLPLFADMRSEDIERVIRVIQRNK